MEPFKPGILSEESAAEQVGPVPGKELECGCGRWYALGTGAYCDICPKRTCGECLAPAIEPVTGEEYEHVCETCRESIEEINTALLFHAHRHALVNEISATLENLKRLLSEEKVR